MAIAADFNLAPEKAVEFFRGKGLAASFAWQDMLHEEHDRAFTVAKMIDLDLLADVKAYVDSAINEGWTRRRFIDELMPTLIKRGWWGRQEMTDPLTGETVDAQLGSARRLKTIYDTNLRTAYAAGHWEKIEINKNAAPYVMYSAVLDGRTRAAHAAWNGKVLRADDAWWKTHTPPNGWNCRCTVIQLSDRDLERMGKSGPDEAPPGGTREWENPRTGEVLQVPLGVDPGWGYAPGASRRAEVLSLAREKLEAADPNLARAGIASLVRSEVFSAWLKKPDGSFPIALADEADAQSIGALTRVVQFSDETAAKQARTHPELKPDEYTWVQEALARGHKRQDGTQSIVYLLADDGYVTIIRATSSGKAIFMTSFRRLSTDAAKRDREIRRLLNED